MYGTQTDPALQWTDNRFENDVKMYGTQTRQTADTSYREFENDVKMYGTQTSTHSHDRRY